MAPPKLQKRGDAKRTFRVDGVVYVLDAADLTPRIERELYTQAGVTPAQAFEALMHGARFGIAAVMFLARRQAGDTVAYQAIEDGLWQAIQRAGEDDFDLAIIEDDDEEVPGPPR